jgi:hypothetical protein
MFNVQCAMLNVKGKITEYASRHQELLSLKIGRSRASSLTAIPVARHFGAASERSETVDGLARRSLTRH